MKQNHIFINIAFIAITIFSRNTACAPLYFPQPSGPYAVGLKRFHWVDLSRKETHSHDDQNRTLEILAWYPSQSNGMTSIVPYHPVLLDFDRRKNYAITMLASEHKPIFARYGYHLTIANSSAPFPILIFSHGWGNVAELYTAYCSELASHGYVVFSVNHTYDCAFVDFPFGKRIIMSPAFEHMPEQELDAFMDSNINTWISDTQFVLNVLEQEHKNPKSIFYQKLNLQRIGALGHSYGGATAIRCSQIDDRFSAACNMDGDLYGASPENPYEKPCLILQANTPQGRPPFGLKKRRRFQQKFGSACQPGTSAHQQTSASTYVIDIPKARHASFTDRPILKHASLPPSLSYGYEMSKEDGFLLTKTVNQLLRAFFDRHLKEIPCEELEWCKI